MPTLTTYKVKTKGNNLILRVAKGHFATGRSHSNFFIDVTVQKSRLSEATALAAAAIHGLSYDDIAGITFENAEKLFGL